MSGNWTLFLIATFVGSSLGGLCRHLLSGWIADRFGERFPVGTMIVNVSGALLIGMVWALPWEDWATGFGVAREFLMFGFLGGYTTVSSFTLQTLNLLRHGAWQRAVLNVLGTWALCLGAVFAGAAVIHTS